MTTSAPQTVEPDEPLGQTGAGRSTHEDEGVCTVVNAGDRIEVESEKVGSATRQGVVVAIEGQLLRVRWDSGQESLYTPSAGAVRVIGPEGAPGAATPP